MKIRTNVPYVKWLACVRNLICIKHLPQFSWHLLIPCQCSRTCVGFCTASELVSFKHGVPLTIASLSILPCPASLHLTNMSMMPGHKLPQMRAGSGQGTRIFYTCFCNGPSFQSEYLDTLYKVVSRKKTNICSFSLGFSLKQMNPWCMKRLSGRLREAECWYKAGHLLLHAPMWGLFSWVKQGRARQAVPL